LNGSEAKGRKKRRGETSERTRQKEEKRRDEWKETMTREERAQRRLKRLREEGGGREKDRKIERTKEFRKTTYSFIIWIFNTRN
jgi:hypothetical protein